VSERYSRQEGLFGREGQAKIASTKVVVFGVGGLGSHVVQQLAYLGVVDFALVDCDVVTESSLNRLVGAVEADVAGGEKKVAVGQRVINAINPGAIVNAIDGRVTDAEAERAVRRADVLFGCVDWDIPRLELTELASRYARPYFDLATDTSFEEQVVYGGRVVYCDGSRCLVCLPDLLDQPRIGRARMDGGMRHVAQDIYGVEQDALAGTGPAVVSLNGVVASAAVMEFVVQVTGLRPARGILTYRADVGALRPSSDTPAGDCIYCQGMWGSAGHG
jgi:hypothetical protein